MCTTIMCESILVCPLKSKLVWKQHNVDINILHICIYKIQIESVLIVDLLGGAHEICECIIADIV